MPSGGVAFGNSKAGNPYVKAPVAKPVAPPPPPPKKVAPPKMVAPAPAVPQTAAAPVPSEALPQPATAAPNTPAPAPPPSLVGLASAAGLAADPNAGGSDTLGGAEGALRPNLGQRTPPSLAALLQGLRY